MPDTSLASIGAHNASVQIGPSATPASVEGAGADDTPAPNGHSPTPWEPIDQEPIDHPDGSGKQVLRGWVHGHAHLDLFVKRIEAGDLAPTMVPTADGSLVAWDDIGEFSFIAEHGFIRLWKRENEGLTEFVSHWDPNDPAHPRAYGF